MLVGTHVGAVHVVIIVVHSVEFAFFKKHLVLRNVNAQDVPGKPFFAVNIVAFAAHFPRCSLAVFDSYGPGFGIYRLDMSNSYVALRIGFIFIVNEFKIYIGVFPVAL